MMKKMTEKVFSGDSVMLQRVVLVLVILFVVGPACSGESGESRESRELAPGWTGKDFSGAEVDFPAVLQGKPTILVFWATWCPYCKALMPYLGEIQREYGEDKINILAVDVFEDGEADPATYVEALGFPVIAVANGDSIAEIYSVRGTPGLMILDGQGALVWKRASTDLPAGKTVAELWAEQVREQLDLLL
jgi:thiol-disulfide isomerase/thioredoxin